MKKHSIKKVFLTGFVILLPVAVTFIIVNFLINLLTTPFENFVFELLNYYNLLDRPFSFLSSQDLLKIFSKFLILGFLFLVTVLLGLFAEGLIVRTFLHLGGTLLQKIPFVNKIYLATQDVVKTLFGNHQSKFSQVVLVSFPHQKALNIGLVTGDKIEEGEGSDYSDRVSVFVMGTPNPTMGFLLLVRREDLIFLTMTVEEALKFVISCGVIYTPFKKINSE